ncbi:hypothetical protein PMAYCL1PPCAC_28549, partial [Pristionchus mayeri]
RILELVEWLPPVDHRVQNASKRPHSKLRLIHLLVELLHLNILDRIINVRTTGFLFLRCLVLGMRWKLLRYFSIVDLVSRVGRGAVVEVGHVEEPGRGESESDREA